MNDPQRGPQRADPMTTLRVLWASMVTSQLVLIIVTSLLPRADPPDETVALVLLLPMLSCGALSLSWGRLLAKDQPPQPRWIVRWALAEACTLMGLASWSAAGEIVPVVCSMLVGVMLVLVQWPREDA